MANKRAMALLWLLLASLFLFAVQGCQSTAVNNEAGTEAAVEEESAAAAEEAVVDAEQSQPIVNEQITDEVAPPDEPPEEVTAAEAAEEAPVAEEVTAEEALIADIELDAELDAAFEEEAPKRMELVYGDIIMDKTTEGMKAGDVEAVLFPHWFHRIRFRCKVCHEDTFRTDKGENNVNMDLISAGESCGMCHDGTVAQDPLECELCHNFPFEQIEEEKAKEREMERETQENILFAGRDGKIAGRGDRRKPAGAARKWGAGWQPRAFQMAGLPKDKYGLVDWIAMTTRDIVLPKGSIDPTDPIYESPIHYEFDEDGEEDIEDIVIPIKSEKLSDVLFPHTLHTWWLNCKSCHPHRFVRTAGDTRMTMKEMGKGKYCGECHGKVAFPLEDCGKCHNREKVEACKESDNCTY